LTFPFRPKSLLLNSIESSVKVRRGDRHAPENQLRARRRALKIAAAAFLILDVAEILKPEHQGLNAHAIVLSQLGSGSKLVLDGAGLRQEASAQ
jgi:hypothetical protein